MLDWPEQTQTSPTATLCTTNVFFPATVISHGPPAASGPSSTFQRPPLSGAVPAVCPARLTVTCSPGSAVPHTATFVPRWSTMLSLINAGRLTLPLADSATPSNMGIAKAKHHDGSLRDR